jgi:hypothetical protein
MKFGSAAPAFGVATFASSVLTAESPKNTIVGGSFQHATPSDTVHCSIFNLRCRITFLRSLVLLTGFGVLKLDFFACADFEDLERGSDNILSEFEDPCLFLSIDIHVRDR